MTVSQEIQYVLPDGRLTYDGLDLLKGPFTGLVPTGTADSTTYLRGDGAWFNPFFRGQLFARVNFNGTGTVAIRGSANVVSITDAATGVYRLNFSTAAVDANYAVAVSTSGARVIAATTNYTTTSVDIECRDETGSLVDVATICAVIFR